MFTTKKIQWFCLIINPYKQLCKSDGRSHNLHHVYNLKCTLCFNMHSKYTNDKLLPKKSYSKMASFSNDRSKKSRNIEFDRDATENKAVSNISVGAAERRSVNSSQEEKSRESINKEVTIDYRISERCLLHQQVNPRHSMNMPIHNLISASGIFSAYPAYPYFLGNVPHPAFFHCYPQFQTNNYNNENNHYVCRLDDGRPPKSNISDAQQDRRLLQEWRRWENANNVRDKSQSDLSCTFTIMTYNVLAQDLLTNHSHLYKYHNPNALPWGQRLKTLLFEIKEHNADILCLQEVQTSHLEIYNNQLKKLGYEGIYKQRTGNTTIDGCAIYYKTSLLTLIDYTSVEYYQPNIFVLNRDNVAIIAKFAPNNNLKNEFVVATTHLLYNPKREDVRLAQTQVLLTEIDRVAYKWKSSGKAHHLPIIITGDFNFMPNTPVYALITEGILKYKNLHSRSLYTTNINNTGENILSTNFLPASLGITDQCQHAELVEQRKMHNVVEDINHVYLYHSERSSSDNYTKQFKSALYSSGVLSHHLPMKSAFDHRRGSEVQATTFQNKWITVDYIFYSGIKENGLILDDKLTLLSRYKLPTSEKLKGVTIPNMAVGSDHFLLVVQFKLNP